MNVWNLWGLALMGPLIALAVIRLARWGAKNPAEFRLVLGWLGKMAAIAAFIVGLIFFVYGFSPEVRFPGVS